MDSPELVLTTRSGKRLNLRSPDPAAIELDDIATALSWLCRFGGQASTFYSVAQHAVLVHSMVLEDGREDLALAALHHDSHEAYAGDLPTPVKIRAGLDERYSEYSVLCDQIDIAVHQRFQFPFVTRDADKDLIKRADRRAILGEAQVLLADQGVAIQEAISAAGVDLVELQPLPTVAPWPAEEARRRFMDAHETYAPS